MSIELIIEKTLRDQKLTVPEVCTLLRAPKKETDTIFTAANKCRAQYMGNDIFLRGIIEFSNYCLKSCNYCGIQRVNKNVPRYRIPDDEILKTCHSMKKAGQTTVVLQSGEDYYYTKERLGSLLERIKNETDLAITLSVGERDKETYAYWKEKGMDRYLLRFETSNRELFKVSHPDDDFDARLACLHSLQELNVQTGSGFLIGLPDETYEDLARDILFCTHQHFDMIGVGPFIPHKETLFGASKNPFPIDVYFKVVSILRLLNKDAHIPSTTAFDAIDPNGRNLLLERGANVFMPNATPQKYRKDYQLYPGKPCVDESGEECAECVTLRVKALGRSIGTGPGHSIRKKKS
jgi:biotin synthase